MKPTSFIRIPLLAALLAANFLTPAPAATEPLSISVDDKGVIRRDDKVIALDELRTLAKEQARKNADVTVSVETEDNPGAAKPAMEVIHAAGLKNVVVHETGSGDRDDVAGISTIRFSDGSKPGTFKVVITNGDIRIRGVDGSEVTVRTDLKPEGTTQRKDGLRVLTSSSNYSLSEKDNVVTLSYGTESWPNGGGDFDISVPRDTNVVISSAFGGDINIAGVAGNLEVKSLNGEVRLNDVSAGALVETMNGEIKADVRSLNGGKPLSFTSMNGAVSLSVPAHLKASVRLRTHNGSILTDFDEKQLVTKTVATKVDRNSHGPRRMDGNDSDEIRATVREAVRMGVDAAREAARGAREAMREARGESGGDDDDAGPQIPVPPVAPLPPMTGGKIVTGSLNGGGPEIRITTMNGDVTLRKLTK